ncbi:hypothetical protein HanPSC8_Chr08g0310071 [Helianthus annuus]|nr:hypothetical protein HanPSC8_Chr08g0310071 [Helianthus annuus]
MQTFVPHLKLKEIYQTINGCGKSHFRREQRIRGYCFLCLRNMQLKKIAL